MHNYLLTLILTKIIYTAKGSNRSWEWLSMITVSIFTLRDVIRQVQVDYKIPHNGISHTSPSTTDDINELREYLKQHKLQTYTPNRDNNTAAVPTRDLMISGAEYANTARAFKTFRNDMRNAKHTNRGPRTSERTHPLVNPEASPDDEDAEPANPDLGGDIDIEVDDLVMDEEEFPPCTDVADFVAMARDVIDELAGDV
jgi:hypothetical protein